MPESKSDMQHNSDGALTGGWITPFLGSVVTILTAPSSAILGSRLAAQKKGRSRYWARHNAIKIDTWVAGWVLAECTFYAVLMRWPEISPWIRVPVLLLAFWRMADILATAIRIPLFDPLRATADCPHAAFSTERIIVLAFINYVELALCFACVYAFWAHLIATTGTGLQWFDPLYLSCVTQLTIGFGDVTPTSGLRLAACFQGMASLGLVILLIGRFMASLRPVPALDDLTGVGAGEDKGSDGG